jgi:hypothetical protein
MAHESFRHCVPGRCASVVQRVACRAPLLCVMLIPGALAGASVHRLKPLLDDVVYEARVMIHGSVQSTGSVPSTGFIVRVLDIPTDSHPQAYILRAGAHDLEALTLRPPPSAAAETRAAVHAASATAVILFSVDFTDPYFRGRAKCPACRLAMLHAGAAASVLVTRLREQRIGAGVVCEVDEWKLFRTWKLPAHELFVCTVVVW